MVKKQIKYNASPTPTTPYRLAEPRATAYDASNLLDDEK